MDKNKPGNELNEDVTRESLIAISYGVPDSDITTEKSPQNGEGEILVQPQSGDGEEDFRSMLISISYSPSPDAKVLRMLPEPLNGHL